MTIENVQNLFAKYQGALNSVSPDLKPEIQAEQKAKIKKELGEPLGDAIRELTREADDFMKVRGQYSDPVNVLAFNALRDAGKVSMGDAAVIGCIRDLPEHMLEIIAETSENPVIQLALFSRGHNNPDLRGKILSRVSMPWADIRAVAGKEAAALQTLAEVSKGLGERPEKLMTIGYRIKDAQKVFESAS
nr:hypothetical protein [Desulfobacula sp.]